jgi:hypothetical protein
MTESLALTPSAVESPLNRDAAFRELREMVLNSVASEHSERNYAKALDEVYALCEERKQPLSRALLMEYRAPMIEKRLSASTVNVRLSAICKLTGEAQRNRIIGAEEAANLAAVPNLSQKTRRKKQKGNGPSGLLGPGPDRPGDFQPCALARLEGQATRLIAATRAAADLRESRSNPKAVPVCSGSVAFNHTWRTRCLQESAYCSL